MTGHFLRPVRLVANYQTIVTYEYKRFKERINACMKGRNPLESRARDVGGILSCGDSPVRGAFSFGRTASRRANQSYSVF